MKRQIGFHYRRIFEKCMKLIALNRNLLVTRIDDAFSLCFIRPKVHFLTIESIARPLAEFLRSQEETKSTAFLEVFLNDFLMKHCFKWFLLQMEIEAVHEMEKLVSHIDRCRE